MSRGWYRRCYIFSHHLSFPLFFSAQENAISYYDSKADSDYVSTVRTALPLPRLPQTPNPTRFPSFSCNPPPPHPPPPPPPPFCPPPPPPPPPPARCLLCPPPPPVTGPWACLCVLVRCFMVSWCDRAGAGQHACDSDFSCPPPV